MNIKKPSWIDDTPHRAGKRLSNIYWGKYPVWKRDEEVAKPIPWTALDIEKVVYKHTFIYRHRDSEIGRETFTTQGSQNVVYHIPSGYILKDNSFKPKKSGTNIVDLKKEYYTISFICTHESLEAPIKITVRKPEDSTMAIEDARNEIIAFLNSKPTNKYDVDVYNFNEFPDHAITINQDYGFIVPLKINDNIEPSHIKHVDITYYVVDDNNEQTILKTEHGRYLLRDYNYIISIPTGYNQVNRIDNDVTHTSIYLKLKTFNINIRYATYNGDTIRQVWHTYQITKKYNETLTSSDLQPLPENLTVGVAPHIYNVSLKYPDDFTFNSRVIINDINIDIRVKASLELVKIKYDEAVNLPTIDEPGVGVYTYGLPTGVIKPNSIRTVKLKFVANSIGLEDGENAFAAILPYNPVTQEIIGNGIELVTNKVINVSIAKSPNFINLLKTEFSGNLNAVVNDIPKYETIYLGKAKDNKFTNKNGYYFDTNVSTYYYVSDNFNKDEINEDRTLKSKWNYRLFDKEFDWTLFDTASINDYNKSQHKCWLIISNIVLHQVATSHNSNDNKIIPKAIAAGLPHYVDEDIDSSYESSYSNSIHGTLPTVQIYEGYIDSICPLTIKDCRYYLCDNAKDFVTDVPYRLKTIDELHGTSDTEGYNRNIIAFDSNFEMKLSATQEYISNGNFSHYYKYDLEGNVLVENKFSFEDSYTSIIKENAKNALTKYGFFLAVHKAHNWWKHYFREDLIDNNIKTAVNTHETRMLCYNFWDMINHGIAKSLHRTHVTDPKLLRRVYEERFGSNMIIKVNLHLLPVCIDVADELFPEMNVAMKEKDFKDKTFSNINPIIVYSPVNAKRVFNNVPRVTFFRYPGKFDATDYDPFYFYNSVNTDNNNVDNSDFDALMLDFNKIVQLSGNIKDYNTYKYMPLVNNNLGYALASHRKLYKYRPELYYQSEQRNPDNSYTTSLHSELLFHNKCLEIEDFVKLRKLRNKFNINPIINHIVLSDVKVNGEDYSKYVTSYVHNRSLSELIFGFSKLFKYNATNMYVVSEDQLRDISNVNMKWDVVLDNVPDDRAVQDLFTRLDTRYKEIIDYNNSITIFDNWKEEVSYDNPQ